MATEQKQKILVVEDGLDYQMILQKALEKDYQLVMADSAHSTFQALDKERFDLILLDIILPDQDGYQICSTLRGREETKNIPIIFVTSKEEIPDKVLGFSLGGDDYVTKPFNTLELRARIAAKMRSHASMSSAVNEQVITHGLLEINVPCQRVSVTEGQEKNPIDLTSTEFRLLHYLAKHLDHVLSREQILDAVWGDSLNVTERTIDTHISKMRKKLRSCQGYIRSVHGSGYRFSVKKESEDHDRRDLESA